MSIRSFENICYVGKYCIKKEIGSIYLSLKQKVFLPLVTDKKIGTGLGLSITQRLLKLNDSYIEYENNRVGATFRIVLPMRNQ